MKKLSLFFLAMSLSVLSFGQEVKNQFEILQAIGEGTSIRHYYSVREEGGKMIGSKGNPYELNFIYNPFEKIYGFQGIYDYSENQTPMVISSEWYTPNHHTQPSFFYNESALNPGIPTKSTTYYIIVGPLLYQLSGEYSEIKAGGNYTIKTKELYHIEQQSAESSTESKGKFGSKLKEKLSSMTTEGGLPDDIANIDHRKAIDAYLAAMEKIQASTNLSSEEQKEIAAIYEAKMINAGKANKANAEFQEFIAASKGNGENRIHIKNTGANAVKIACGGTVYTVYPGKEENCACSLKITYARQEGNSWKPGGQTISNDGDNCGKTINIQ